LWAITKDELLTILRGGDGLDERVGLLDDADMEYARALAAGEIPGEHRAEAMALLVSTRAAGTVDALRRVIYNEEEDIALRAAAVRQMARVGHGAEGDLINVARQLSEPELLAEVVRGMALVGSPQTLAVLDEVSDKLKGDLREQVRFSQAVVAARARVEGYELPVPRDGELELPDPDHALALVIEPIGEAQLAAGRRRRIETYGTDPDWDGGVHIQAGPQDMVMLLERGLRDHDLVALAQKVPVLYGLIAQRVAPDGPYATRWLILSWPGTESHFHLALHRPTGEQDLYGYARVAGDEARFAMATVRGSGVVPTELTGWIKGSLIGLSAGAMAPGTGSS
jgi:hypothetical protein